MLAAVEAGQPPDFLFGTNTDYYYGQWAYDGRLVDLSDVIGPLASLFDPDALSYAMLLDATTGQTALYALPMGSSTHHLHVWRSLLEQAGFTLEDIPKRVGGILVVLVRPGPAGGAPGHRPRRHLGRRAWPCRSADDTWNRIRAVHAGL